MVGEYPILAFFVYLFDFYLCEFYFESEIENNFYWKGDGEDWEKFGMGKRWSKYIVWKTIKEEKSQDTEIERKLSISLMRRSFILFYLVYLDYWLFKG